MTVLIYSDGTRVHYMKAATGVGARNAPRNIYFTPMFTEQGRFPLTINDEATTLEVVDAL